MCAQFSFHGKDDLLYVHFSMVRMNCMQLYVCTYTVYLYAHMTHKISEIWDWPNSIVSSVCLNLISFIPRSRTISFTIYFSIPRLCSGCKNDRNSSSFSSWSAGGLSAWNHRSFRLSKTSWAARNEKHYKVTTICHSQNY